MSDEPRAWHMAPEADEIAACLRLKRACEAAGKEPGDFSSFAGGSASNYYDLENCHGELYRTIGLGELSALCSALEIKARNLFNDGPVVGQEISPQQLTFKAETYMRENQFSVAEFEERIGFAIGPSLKDAGKVMEWNVDFLRWLCRELEVDWHLALP